MNQPSPFLLLVALATACNSGIVDKDIDEEIGTTTDGGDVATTTDSGDDGSTDGGDDGSTDGGDDGATDSGAELVGAWSRDEPLRMDGEEVDAIWTAREDGSCTVELIFDGFSDQFRCDYTAAEGVFTMTDDECREAGSYTYTVSGDALSFALIEDGCEERGSALSSAWSRM